MRRQLGRRLATLRGTITQRREFAMWRIFAVILWLFVAAVPVSAQDQADVLPAAPSVVDTGVDCSAVYAERFRAWLMVLTRQGSVAAPNRPDPNSSCFALEVQAQVDALAAWQSTQVPLVQSPTDPSFPSSPAPVVVETLGNVTDSPSPSVAPSAPPPSAPSSP
jgi:hypothetical protein